MATTTKPRKVATKAKPKAATKAKPKAAKPKAAKPKAAKAKIVNHRLTAKPKPPVVVVAQHGDGILGSIFPFLGAIGL